MATLNITAARNVGGLLQGSYVTVPAGVNFTGTVGHGNVLTITDSLHRFGTRTTVKPLFVNLGDSRFGSALGRITTEHLSANAVSDTVIKAGALLSSWKLDFKVFGNNGIIGQPITTQNQTRPLIQYVERRYGFDFTDPRIQNNFYFIGQSNDANTMVFTLIIDGRTYSHTNNGTAGSINNGAFVRDTLVALINGDALCKCTAAVNDGRLHLIKKTLTDYFDVTYPVTYRDEIYQNFNNKCNRIYAWNDATTNDAILLTRGYGARSQSYMENTAGSTAEPYYDAKPLNALWMSDQLVLKNSSSGGASDGYYRHYRNSELLNPTMSVVTHNAGQQPLGRCYLNQMDGGGYWRADLPINVGYQCWDDEFLGIYLADSATIVQGTTVLVRQPQVTWSANTVSFQQVHSLVNPIGAHVFLCVDENTFTYIGAIS